MSRYQHTQSSPLGVAFAVAAGGCLGGLAATDDRVIRTLCLAMAVIAALFATMFSRLVLTETDTALRVRFGPLPWGGTSVRYDQVRRARRTRTSLFDGLGIHWFPGRGWTFNLWGRDCVEIATDRGVVRLGTDAPDDLVAHLQQRTGCAID